MLHNNSRTQHQMRDCNQAGDACFKLDNILNEAVNIIIITYLH